MKQWLFVVKCTMPDMLVMGPTREEANSVTRHFQYWQQLTVAGVALVVGRTQTTGPETMGLAIFAAGTDEEALAIAKQDPAVEDGVFEMSLYPYQVALLGDVELFEPAG